MIKQVVRMEQLILLFFKVIWWVKTTGYEISGVKGVCEMPGYNISSVFNTTKALRSK